ncbi:MAG: hypothetical protein AAF631_11960 [Pseudomonadota bacterium]
MARQDPIQGARYRDRHSRFVRVLRWVLPGTALILLASIFLISNTSTVRRGLIIADAKLAELAIGQKITNPSFSGVTRSGDAFTISAEWALPDAPRPEKIELSGPRTTIDFEGGRKMETWAGRGLLDLEASEATLSDTVVLKTSNGYDAQSAALLLNFETGNLYSIGRVAAEGPMGSIEAGSMTLLQNLDENPAGEAVLIFTGGVKLIYRPKRE